MRNDELPIDYEKETPGLTGFYKNLVNYPNIVYDWSDKELSEQTEKLNTLLETQPRNGNNEVRLELMERSKKLLMEEGFLRVNTDPDCYVCGLVGYVEEYGANKLRRAPMKEGLKTYYFHDQCWLEWNALYKGTDKE